MQDIFPVNDDLQIREEHGKLARSQCEQRITDVTVSSAAL